MNRIILRISALMCLIAVCLLSVACPDGERMADSIFKANGMNRLRVITTKVKPGGILIVKDGRATYVGGVEGWSGATPPAFTISHDDAVIAATNSSANLASGANVTIKKLSSNTNANMTAAVANEFINSALPISAAGKIQFSGSVQFDQIYATENSFDPIELGNYLQSQSSATLRENLSRYDKAGFKIYVVYDTYTSNKLRIVSTSGSNVSATANMNQVYDVGAGLSYVKNSNTSLVVDDSRHYTFAIRSVLIKKQSGNWLPIPGTYGGTGLAASSKVKYASSPIDLPASKNFSVLDLAFDEP